MCGPRMNKNIQLCLVGCSVCISILALLMVMVALGFRNQDLFQENSEWEATADKAFIFTLLTAAVIIFTAICGCMTAKHQGMLKYVFGVFLLIITIILIVVSTIVGSVTNLSEDQVDEVCAGETPVEQLEYIQEIDEFQNQWVGKYMCTTLCPCDMTEDTTGYYQGLTASQVSAKVSTRYEDESIYFAQSDETAYSTFADCFSSGELTSDTEKWQSTIDLANYLEQEFECSGVCEPGLFFWTLDLSYGAPSQTCVTSLQDALGSEGKVFGLLLILTTLIMIGMLLVQYVLWTSSKR